MPDGWGPASEAFIDGARFGVYVALLVLLVLIVLTTVRRVLEV